jgi:hypothetical protein
MASVKKRVKKAKRAPKRTMNSKALEVKKNPGSKETQIEKNPTRKKKRVKKTQVKKNPPSSRAHSKPAKRPASKKRAKALEPVAKTRRTPPRVRKAASKRPASKRKAKTRTRQTGLVLGGLVRVPRKDVVSVLRKLDKANLLVGTLTAALAELRAQRATERARGKAEKEARRGTTEKRKRESAEVRKLRKALAEQTARTLKAEEDLNQHRLTEALLKAEPVEVLRHIGEYENLLQLDQSDVGREAYMQFLASRAENTAGKVGKSVEEVLFDIAKDQGFTAREVFHAWHSPSLSYAV